MSVYGDLIDGSWLQEEDGQVTSAHSVYVIVIPKAGESLFRRALQDGRVPQPSESLAPEWADVRVTSRQVALLATDDSNAKLKIDIGYELQALPEDSPIYSGSSTLVQVRTQVDKDGRPIVLEYQGEKVRGEIDALEPERRFERVLIEETNSPELLKEQWEGTVNADLFLNLPARGWLLGEIRYEPLDVAASPKRYRFFYSFIGKRFYEREDKFGTRIQVGGHQYTAVFKNTSGDIPEDVLEGVGIKDIPWHREADFSRFVPP